MDWITQNKFRNWLLVVLLASNLLTVSIIWMQTARTREPQRDERGSRASESVNLMKKALDLDEGQADRAAQILADRREQSKKYEDRLSELKKELAEGLFKGNPDTSSANTAAMEIGALQAKVEMIRFSHFQELLAICTTEQREKLKPIVIEVFGRRPPKDESGEGKRPRGGREEGNPGGENTGKPHGENPGVPHEDNPQDLRGDNGRTSRDAKPEPPSVDEKLAKYSERLRLTEEQAHKIRSVLAATRKKAEALRMRVDPDRNEIQAEKERIRKEEDESVLQLLNEEQRAEFARMIAKRKP